MAAPSNPTTSATTSAASIARNGHNAVADGTATSAMPAPPSSTATPTRREPHHASAVPAAAAATATAAVTTGPITGPTIQAATTAPATAAAVAVQRSDVASQRPLSPSTSSETWSATSCRIGAGGASVMGSSRTMVPSTTPH